MNNTKREELYYDIDAEEDMSDREKRDAYFAEIEEIEAEERWEREQLGY